MKNNNTNNHTTKNQNTIKNTIQNTTPGKKLINKWTEYRPTVILVPEKKWGTIIPKVTSTPEEKLIDNSESKDINQKKTINFLPSKENAMKKQKPLYNLNKKRKDKIFEIKNYIGKKRRIVPVNDLGLPRHFLSATKEWYNSIYTYNRNEMRSVKSLDLSVSKLIKTYFNSTPNSFFLNKKRKRMVRKKWQLLTNKVYLSRSELKHTSSKVTITLYLFAERNINLTYIYKYLNKQNMNLSFIKQTGLLDFHYFCENYPHIMDKPEFINKMRINLDKFKLNFEKYLKLEKKLNNIINFLENKISKCYKKKVEIKIIRLKYLYLNNHMLAEYIALKLITKKRNLFRAKRKIFKKIKFPYVNKYDINKIRLARRRIWLKSFRNESHETRGIHIWDQWRKNKYFRPEIMTDQAQGKINDSYKDFLEYLNYKFPIGIRLGIAGRLTRRNVAARAIKKYTYIGSIKNIDSSFRNLSVSNLRGCLRPNIEFTKINALARTGAFTVRSWLSKY